MEEESEISFPMRTNCRYENCDREAIWAPIVLAPSRGRLPHPMTTTVLVVGLYFCHLHRQVRFEIGDLIPLNHWKDLEETYLKLDPCMIPDKNRSTLKWVSLVDNSVWDSFAKH